MSSSLNLALPYVAEAQSQKHVTVNDALRRLDTVVQLSIENRTRNSPPANPSEGARYIVGAAATGAWSGQARAVAGYIDGAWEFFAPQPGWLAYVKDENVLVFFDGSGWEVLVATGAQEQVSKLGVNTTASISNRLTVRARNSLFHADTAGATGDVQVTLSKDSFNDTASHVYQTNYSGRAEFGLIGSDEFSLKVSSDGSNFSEAFRVSNVDARVEFALLPTVGGAKPFGFSVESRENVSSVFVPSDVNVLDTRGYASEGDGGGGRYVRIAGAPSVLGMTDAAGGRWELEGNTVTARQAGARGDGTVDDTAALRDALASGRDLFLDEGEYRVTGVLPTGAHYQRVIGAGRGRTVITVEQDFDLTAVGVIYINHLYVTVEGLTLQFDQGGVSSRATVVRYPPAIYLVDQFRARIRNIRVRAGWDGIDATGNCGGSIFDDVELGTFNVGIRLGGSLDTVELHNTRVWPYGIGGEGSTLGDIYADGQTIGFQIGQVDDLKMSNCTPFQARVVIEDTGGKVPFGTITGLALDGKYSSIEMSAGFISISSLYATTNVADDSFISLTGGDLVVSDVVFRGATTQAVPMVSVSGGNCQIQNGAVRIASSQAVGFQVSGGQLAVSSIHFSLPAAQDRTGALIHATGGALTAYGNTSTQRGATGSGPFIRVETDGHHLIYGNDSNGYSYELPTPRTLGLYGPNRDDGGVRVDHLTRFKALDNGSEGGELVIEGAGTHSDVRIDNNAGNLRLFGFGAGKTVQVLGTSGVASLSPDRVTFANGNAMVGGGAGTLLTGGNNVGVGSNTHAQSPAAVTNATAIGSGASVGGSNEVQLGNSATTTYAYGAVQMRSDGRDKTDVRDTTLGLSFLNALRPVDFRWDYREDYERPADLADDAEWEPPTRGSKQRKRYHHGFIAQEIEAVLKERGIDFGGYQDRAIAGGRDVKSIGYTELVAPLVKAVQELSDRLEAIEARF